MIIRSERFAVHILIACILLTNLIISKQSYASNKAINMKVVESEEKIRLLLQLGKRPKYSLKSISRDQLQLTFDDTVKAPSLTTKNAGKNTIKMSDDEGSSDLKLKIGLAKPFKDIHSSWLSHKKLLYLHITYGDEPVEKKMTDQRLSKLKTIRFGFKENAARMVMGLDQRPLWEMTYKDPTSISIELDATSDSLKGRRYGPIKWLSEVIVQKKDNHKMGVLLKPESQLNHIRIFWMEVGNRLVMDLFDEPEKIAGKGLIMTPTPESQNEKGVVAIKDDDSKQGAGQEQSIEIPSTGIAHVVRMKIPERERPASDHSADNGSTTRTAVNNNPVMIEPKLDNIFPDSPDMRESVQDLRPEEAFLFGRIQEAMEINDYEKGALLTGHFLNEFPASTLIEKVSFWHGDLQYNLWKRGDKSIGGSVIRSYKSAIDRFGRSKYTPFAYIKMAQISSEMGSHYDAVGYLSLIINKKETGDYIPLAYITRGKIYLRMDQPEKGIKDFQSLLSDYPKSTYAGEANFWIANYFHVIGMYEEAEKRLNEIADSNPNLHLEYPEYLFLNAQNYLYLKNYDLARDYLFKTLNIGHHPESIDLLLSRIGDTYHHQSNEKEAEKYYRMVIDYYPDSEGASISKLRLADYFSDIAILEDLSNQNVSEPISNLAVLEKAYQLYEKERFLDVIDSLKELIEKPLQTETRKEAKQLYFKAAEKWIDHLYHAGSHNALIDLYRSKKEKLTNNIHPEIVLMVAQSFSNLHFYGEALAAFLQIKPYDLSQASRGKYFIGLARSYIAEGDDNNAQKLLEENRKNKLNAGDRQMMTMLLADIRRKRGKLKDAYALYQSLVRDKRVLPAGDIAKAYLYMGRISSSKGEYENARNALNRCMALIENDQENKELLKSAHMELGHTFYDEKMYMQAAKYFERGFDLGYGPDKTDYWETRFKLALSYMEVGKDNKAEPLLSEISEGGDTLLQQKAQIRLGALGLEKHLKRLSIMSE